MADRFPSLEEFDAVQSEAPGIPSFEATSASDFLSREIAVLGDDANQFQTQDDNIAALRPEGNEDLLGGDFRSPEVSEEVSLFETSFPAIDTRDEDLPSVPALPITDDHSSSYVPTPFYEEPEVVKEWRERRDLALAERATLSEERKQEAIKNAQQNIDDFYENYNTKKEKSIAQTRREAEDFIAAREDTSAGGTSWERISKLVDLSGKGAIGGASGTDKARFRDLLISLKKDQNAPGASGC